MRLPTQTHALAPGLVVSPEDVPQNVVQAHLMKHPFGVPHLFGGRSLDHERFPELGIAERMRVAAIAAIRRLYVGRDTCTLPELRAQPPREFPEKLPCYTCPSVLVGLCASATTEPAARYAAIFDEMLAAVSAPDARVVNRAELAKHWLG